MTDIFISSLNSALASWVEAFPDLQVVHSIDEVEAEKNAELVFWIHKNGAADLEKSLPDTEQLFFTQTIRSVFANYTAAKIVVLANIPNQTESVHALRLGALGYCHAYSEAALLKEVKSVVCHGGIWIGQDILRRLIEASTKLAGSQQVYIDGLLEKLTVREQEVALETAKGLSNKEIARTLKITERTVKAHLAKIFERLGAKDRLQLALMLSQSANR